MKIKMSPAISKFVSAHNNLVQEWQHTNLKFTLDGKLVGDIAEAIAADLFDLDFPDKRTPGVDLVTKTKQTVQVKASGINKGPAFTPGKGKAEYLIFFLLDFEECTAEIVYNGLEAPIRDRLPEGFSGTKRVRLSDVLQINEIQNNRLKLARKEK